VDRTGYKIKPPEAARDYIMLFRFEKRFFDLQKDQPQGETPDINRGQFPISRTPKKIYIKNRIWILMYRDLFRREK
jgi:hypothetical protein